MKPVLLVNPSLGGFEARLQQTYDVVHWPQDEARAAEITAALVIGGTGLSNETITSLPNLKLIACASAGYDGIDLPFAKSRGVSVTNCPNTNNEDVADMAIGLLISAVRRIAEGDRRVRAGQWRRDMPFTPRFWGKKLGIVGLGAIGRAIAERAQAFHMDIAWQGPRAKPDALWRYEPDLLKLADWCDCLVIACPASPETHRMIDRAVIEAVGRQGTLVNIARGSIVDEDALIEALKSGALGHAGLDVFEEEPTPAERWTNIPNVTLMPHLGGATLDSVRETQRLAAENVRRFFAGEPLKTPV